MLVAFMVVCAGVAVDAGRAATLFGLVDTGELFFSADGGATWSVKGTLPVSDAVAVAAAESSDELLLATRSGLVFRSVDAGMNWTAVGAVSASDVVDMAIRTNGDIFLLSATGTVWRSQDNGATFTTIATLTASNFVSLTGDAGGGNMFALTETGEVSRSVDFGAVWNTVGVVTTPDAVDIRAAGLDLFVLTGTGNIAMSTDMGATWLTVGTISQVHMVGLTTNGGGLVAATEEGLVAISGDAATWTFTGSINQLTVVAIGNDTPNITGIGDQPPRFSTFRVRSVWPSPGRGNGDPIAISIELPAAARVTLEAYNVAGQLVSRRAPQALPRADVYTIRWNVEAHSTGMYFIRVVTDSGLKAHAKFVVVR
jgi:hypothetical protein